MRMGQDLKYFGFLRGGSRPMGPHGSPGEEHSNGIGGPLPRYGLSFAWSCFRRTPAGSEPNIATDGRAARSAV